MSIDSETSNPCSPCATEAADHGTHDKQASEGEAPTPTGGG